MAREIHWQSLSAGPARGTQRSVVLVQTSLPSHLPHLCLCLCLCSLARVVLHCRIPAPAPARRADGSLQPTRVGPVVVPPAHGRAPLGAPTLGQTTLERRDIHGDDVLGAAIAVVVPAAEHQVALVCGLERVQREIGGGTQDIRGRVGGGARDGGGQGGRRRCCCRGGAGCGRGGGRCGAAGPRLVSRVR